MRETLDPPPRAHILDIGCGTGLAAAQFAEDVPQGRVLGIDPAEEMIRVANGRAEGAANLSFALGCGHDIPADDDSFDLAFSTISFHHWTRPAESIVEIARVLRPGGRVCILDMCRSNLIMMANDWLSRRFERAHFGIATPSQMGGWLTAAGFKQVCVTRPRMFLMLADGRLPAD